MGYYPVYLDLTERPCVVIGSGEEAERKARELVEAGASVTFIGTETSREIEEMAERDAITLLRRPYQKGDLRDAFLAIAATPQDIPLSMQIYREAQEERTLLNVVDVTYLCTWIAPAVVRRGNLTLAIATGGRSPAMARKVREELERSLPQEYADLLEILALVRSTLRSRHIRPDPEAWQRAMDDETMRLLHQGEWESVQERLVAALTRSVEVGKPRE
jgi:precorrin-2 dehydrogenase/sirohydrochlorin ferrochelatase